MQPTSQLIYMTPARWQIWLLVLVLLAATVSGTERVSITSVDGLVVRVVPIATCSLDWLLNRARTLYCQVGRSGSLDEPRWPIVGPTRNFGRFGRIDPDMFVRLSHAGGLDRAGGFDHTEGLDHAGGFDHAVGLDHAGGFGHTEGLDHAGGCCHSRGFGHIRGLDHSNLNHNRGFGRYRGLDLARGFGRSKHVRQ